MRHRMRVYKHFRSEFGRTRRNAFLVAVLYGHRLEFGEDS